MGNQGTFFTVKMHLPIRQPHDLYVSQIQACSEMRTLFKIFCFVFHKKREAGSKEGLSPVYLYAALIFTAQRCSGRYRTPFFLLAP